MNATQAEQGAAGAAGDEPSEDRDSWDAEYEEKEPRPRLDADRYLDDPRRGQARLINRRIE